MLSLLQRGLLLIWVFVAPLASAQHAAHHHGAHHEERAASTSQYVGYNLTLEGDDNSVIYSTDDTGPNADYPEPDVYLNATGNYELQDSGSHRTWRADNDAVHVGTIDLQVDNLTAKINLDAQVLNLLSFNAGVDLSIDEVRLLIQNVNAKVLLEARLENLVRMINKTLSSIDLNPVIATLGEDVGSIVNTTASALGSSSSSLAERSLSYELEHNILYSTNNYRANKHTNQILAQNGNIVAHHLDNDGDSLGQTVVGNYKDDMTFTGYETTVERNGEEVTEREYMYYPAHGLSAICAVYINSAGSVVGTQVIAESGAGGSSTISEDS